jgi:hypothetical protein
MLWGILHMNNLDFIMPVLLDNYSVEQSLAIVLAWAFMAALCIVIGYAFVGGALLIERALKRRGLFVEEKDSGDDVAPASLRVLPTAVAEVDPESGNV